MLKRLTVLFVFFLAACSPPPALQKLPADAKIVAFGDSLTLGTGGQVSYPERLAKLISRSVINAGVRSETTAQAKKRLPQVIKEHQPNLLIICTGGNDFLRRQSEATAEANLRDIVAIATEANIPVVLIAVPRFSIFPTNHPLYEKVAEDNRLWLEDSILKAVLHDNALKADQVHPNDAGYAEIAAAVAELLAESGAI